MRRILSLGLILIGAMSAAASSRTDHPTPACSRVFFEADSFLVCRYDPQADAMRLMRRGADGRPGSLPEVAAALGAEAAHVRFAMNAGMYHPDHSPVGLYVAAGREEHPIERAEGVGNFYMRPNGVFWTDGAGTPHVDETEAYAARLPDAAWATQSGPLLLADGALHPAISANGPSRLIRNAVGIAGTKAFFVISETPVSFGRLARFFRDHLGCRDALYLYGTVSSLWSTDLARQDKRSDLGTFLVVLRR
ncbi:phosphodiester glycosidase family protein [Flavisphingomonas formosensis]|uniref:phosphodiester glycosidase family protein n=1 Tax=Flavisphingomonas formosensis TaxID=861534 RepID=UPI0012F8BDB9|nr:phosphodiester glycosidase family protein [Sphingomonas formosensis]